MLIDQDGNLTAQNYLSEHFGDQYPRSTLF
jgi:hypothetical protein